MKMDRPVKIVLAAAMLGVLVVGLAAGSLAQGSRAGPILKPNPEMDKRTVIAPSTIPGAGNGLFARVRIKKGDIIGELGGQLITELNSSQYVAWLPECGQVRMRPYKFIDSKEHGGHVSRINFAPRVINGTPTNFQNSMLQRVCYSPWIVFVALRDIEPGEEIWTSYGPDYNYETFMGAPEIKAFFCGKLGIDCSAKFKYDH